MIPKRLKKMLPTRDELKNHPHLKHFGDWLHHPNLWHFNRKSVAGAVGLGLFACFLPVPGQMAVSGTLAILLRRNVPISVAMVWLTNPLTMAPVFYITYTFGAFLTGAAPLNLNEVTFSQITLEWVESKADLIWLPFLVGSVATGMISGAMGYFGVLAIWRWRIWNMLAKKRAKKNGAS